MQIEVLHPDYIESVLNYTFESLEEATYVINLSYITTFNIFDEKTLLPFDFADPTSVTCLVFCEDKTEYYDVNSSVDEVPITCDYIKIKFVLEYPEGVSYYRKYLIEDGDLFNQSIYLIDASDTPYVYTAFIIDDLLGKYENPSIWIKKMLSSGTEVIQSANIDIENKVGSYLIENDEYVIEVHSDNLPIQIIGEYDADEGEDKSINMYDINLASDPTGFSQSVTYTMKVINDTDTNISSVLFTYYDKDELTDSVQFRVYADRLNGTLIYESASYVNVSEVASLLFPLTGYENRTVVSEIEISHQDAGAQTVSRLLNKVWLVTLPMQKYITQESMNWFFIIFLSVIAIMSTSATSTAGLVVAGLAIIFRLFGWMEVSGGVLALAFLISLLDFFAKQGGR
jgi:hypothetical protein